MSISSLVKVFRRRVRQLVRSVILARPLALAFAIAIGGSMVAPARLLAQGCNGIDPPCPPNQPPHVVISPSGGTYTTPSVAVTVYLTDDGAMNPATLEPSGLTGSWTSDHSSATLNGTLTLSAGTNVYIVDITDTGGLHGADTVTFTYTPPPPPPSQDSAKLSLAPYSNTVRAVSGCAACLYGAATYATPSYVSRDQSRSIALVYSSATAVPMGLVQLDATVHTTTIPNYLSLQLRHNGSPITLTNGGAQAYFTGDTGTVRLAAQFDASGFTTGFYDDTADVTTWFGSTPYHSRIPIRVLIINSRSNVTGAGWDIAGLQQLWNSSGDSVAITDGSGGIVFFERSGTTTFAASAGDFTTLTVSGGVYTRTAPDGSWSRFNSSGRLTATGTRFNDSTTYLYDGSNRLTSVTDEAGHTTTLTYAPNGSCPAGATSGTLCLITTPGGRTSGFVVNSSNDLVQVVDPDGVTALSATYSSHELVTATNRLGGITRFAYDAFSGLASITTPAVTTTTTGGSTSTDSATTSYQSVEKALLASANTSSGSARAYVTADTAYAKVTAPDGTVSKFVLAGPGEAASVVLQPVTGSTQTTTVLYNADYLPTSITQSPVGGTTTYSWSGGDLTSTTDPNGTRMDFTYSSYHQPHVIWVNGIVQQTNYYSGTLATLDSTVLGSDTQSQGAKPPKTAYTWDSHGRLTQTLDRDSHSTSNNYDATGFQNTHQTWIGGASATYVYDKYGRDSIYTDPNGNSTTVIYDVLNRPASLTQPGPAITSTSYSENAISQSLTTTVTDPRSSVFSSIANALGWTTSNTDPQSHTATMGYDRNGFLRRAVNRMNEVATFSYDSLGRMTLRSAGSDTARYSYDASTSPADPHWAVAANSESRDSVTTDAKGSVQSIVSKPGSLSFTSTMTYDHAGNRKLLRVSNGTWTDSLVFENDSISAPWELPDFGGDWTRIRYTIDGLVDTLRYPTGTSTTRLQIHPSSYNHYLRPGVDDVYVGSTLKQHWWLTYDNVGRVTYIDSGSAKDYVQRHFTYDVRNRLASYADDHIYADSVQESCPDFQITCDPPPPWDYTWHDVSLRSTTYNPDYSGNRTDGAASLTHDRLSTMTGADGRAYSLSYDNEGRLTAKTASGYSQTYGWNPLGQLLWVKTNGDSVAYGYDAHGRRVRKYHAGTTTYYVWDAANLLMQVDGSGNRTFEYSYQPGVDAPVAVKSGGSMYYYQLDETGSVAAVWNTSNSTVASYTYDPYGYTVASSGTLTQPLRWKGAQYDTETGLYYMRARYYDPTVGRFISEDPIGLGGGINPYAYSDGDPVNGTDPSGLSLECTPIISWETEGFVIGLYSLSVPVPVITGWNCIDTGGNKGPSLPAHEPAGAGAPSPGPGRAAKPQQCAARTLVPHGYGFDYSFAAEAGSWAAGGSAQEAVGVGRFYDESAGFSSGAFLTQGSVAYGAGMIGGTPTQQGQPRVVGSYVGAGLGGFITNAHSVQQTGGPFTTVTLNVGLGPITGSIQLSYGSGIWVLNVSPPIPVINPGAGWSLSKITTNTVPTPGGCQ